MHDVERMAELEGHVQDAADDLDGDTLTREEKLLVSAHRLGLGDSLDEEFRKVTPLASWKTPIYWAAAGVGWALGVEGIFQEAVTVGAHVRHVFGLPVAALSTWIVIVHLVGPIVAFGSVWLWMRSRPANHPASRRALFISTLVAFALRIALVPLAKYITGNAWGGIDQGGFDQIFHVWHVAGMMGLVLVAGAAALAFARFRKPIDVAPQ